MTRSPWIVLGVAVGFAAFGPGVKAQQVVSAPVVPPVVSAPGVVSGPIAAGGGIVVSDAPIAGVPIVAGPVLGSGVGVGSPFAASRSGPIMPYSYYVNFPAPARIYEGYGPNDGFPFHGQLYGHAGDRWSWSAMSTGNGSLAKYYYQILP